MQKRCKAPFLALALGVCAACLTRFAAAENLQGYAKGHVQRAIGLTENGPAPLLQSFYFRYTSSDHHIQALEVLPNVPQVNQASFGYTDRNDDDEYFYNVTFAPYFGEIFHRTHGREVCKGSCTYALQAPADRANYIFVIRGFYIYYQGTDHHVDQLKIQERNGSITVAFNDKNDDDNYIWELRYAYIPKSRISEIGARSGLARGGQRVSIPSGTAVIRGFNFDFRHEDHHIQDLGVMLRNGTIEVYYGDKNQDDAFDWNVEYAVLRPFPLLRRGPFRPMPREILDRPRLP